MLSVSSGIKTNKQCLESLPYLCYSFSTHRGCGDEKLEPSIKHNLHGHYCTALSGVLHNIKIDWCGIYRASHLASLALLQPPALSCGCTVTWLGLFFLRFAHRNFARAQQRLDIWKINRKFLSHEQWLSKWVIKLRNKKYHLVRWMHNSRMLNLWKVVESATSHRVSNCCSKILQDFTVWIASI